jgi:hypothetical protein
MSIFSFSSKNKHTNRQREGLFEVLGNNPYVDWAIAFSCGVMLSVLLIFVGVRVYLSTTDQLSTLTPLSAASRVGSFDAVKLRSVLAHFDGMKDQWNSILKRYSGPTDPSI